MCLISCCIGVFILLSHLQYCSVETGVPSHHPLHAMDTNASMVSFSSDTQMYSHKKEWQQMPLVCTSACVASTVPVNNMRQQKWIHFIHQRYRYTYNTTGWGFHRKHKQFYISNKQIYFMNIIRHVCHKWETKGNTKQQSSAVACPSISLCL